MQLTTNVNRVTLLAEERWSGRPCKQSYAGQEDHYTQRYAVNRVTLVRKTLV